MVQPPSVRLLTEDRPYRGDWASGTAYIAGDMVTTAAGLWVATQASTGTIPSVSSTVDYAGKWRNDGSLGQLGPIGYGAVYEYMIPMKFSRALNLARVRLVGIPDATYKVPTAIQVGISTTHPTSPTANTSPNLVAAAQDATFALVSTNTYEITLPSPITVAGSTLVFFMVRALDESLGFLRIGNHTSESLDGVAASLGLPQSQVGMWRGSNVAAFANAYAVIASVYESPAVAWKKIASL